MTERRRPPSEDEARELKEIRGGTTDASVIELGPRVPPTTAGIVRIVDGPNSLVCKVLHHVEASTSPWAPSSDPAHPYYWRREALVYESALVARLAGRLRAPECLGVFDRADGSVAIWLHDERNTTPGRAWPLARYGEAAFDLGVAQASASELADNPPVWLSRKWLRAYVARRTSDIALLDDRDPWRRHPLVRTGIAPATIDAVRELWQVRDWLLARVDALPRTICHLDMHPDNLFADASGTVVIDWAYAGVGCIGEDVGNLALDALFDFHLRPGAAPELERVLLDGYTDGLAAAGVNVARDVVELGMAASVCVKYLWIVPAMLRAVLDGQEMLNRRPIAETFSVWSGVVPHIVAHGRRAFALAHRFGIALPA